MTLGLRLPSSLSRAVAIAEDGSVLVIGGLTGSGRTTGAILRLDTASGSVTRIGRLAQPVHDAAAASLGGMTIVFGGGRAVPGSFVQEVDPNGSSRVIGHLPAPRADLAAVAVGDEVVVVGGGTSAGPDRRVLATRDGIRFREIARLKVGVRYPAVATAGGIVYVIGGEGSSSDRAEIQRIDPATGSVAVIGRLPRTLSHAAAFVIGDRIIVAGGRRGGSASDAVWQLDPATGQVDRIARLPYPVSDVASVVEGTAALLIGGEAGTPVASVVSVQGQ